ncbi:putative endopeptidase, NLPC/P60 domain, LRAT-like domain protein [Tanacetum coccineum]
MDLFSQKIDRSELKEGDHIYTWRKQLYSHHGIFVGEGKIIHFVSTIRDYEGSRFLAPLKILSGVSTSHHKEKSPCSVSYCGMEKVAESGVKVPVVEHALWRNLIQEDVMHRATYLYENGYGKYDLMNNNCEDFALYCKTGLWSTDKESQGRSSQANMVRPTRHAKKDKDLVESVTRIATYIPRSFSKRENKDLGHRNDVVKLDEELAFKLHAEEQVELERMQRERVAQGEASSAVLREEFDDVQARIDADALLAARLQEEEREQF